MLSRVADSIFWMSRYIERAENVARFIDVNMHLALDLVVVSVWLMLRLARSQSGLAIAIALSLGMLIYPATLNHYSLLLILPLLVLWQTREGLRHRQVVLLASFISSVEKS